MIKYILYFFIPSVWSIATLFGFVVVILQIAKASVDPRKYIEKNGLELEMVFALPVFLLSALIAMFVFYPMLWRGCLGINNIEIIWLSEYVEELMSFLFYK